MWVRFHCLSGCLLPFPVPLCPEKKNQPIISTHRAPFAPPFPMTRENACFRCWCTPSPPPPPPAAKLKSPSGRRSSTTTCSSSRAACCARWRLVPRGCISGGSSAEWPSGGWVGGWVRDHRDISSYIRTYPSPFSLSFFCLSYSLFRFELGEHVRRQQGRPRAGLSVRHRDRKPHFFFCVVRMYICTCVFVFCCHGTAAARAGYRWQRVPPVPPYVSRPLAKAAPPQVITVELPASLLCGS